MEMSDGFGQREAEPRSLVRPARIEPAEPAPCLVTSLGRNAGSAVADLDANVPVAGLDPDANLAAAGAITDRILNQVADGLREQLAMPEQRDGPRRAVIFERRAALVGERVVHFGKLGSEFANVEPVELLAPGQRLGAANFEH